MPTSNLLNETIKKLADYEKTIEDIVWVGSSDGYIPVEKFIKLADVEYYNGYGGAEVAIDLVVVGKDFYMTRGDYGGKEWWDYHSMDLVKKPEKELEVKTLIATSGYGTLSNAQGGE